MTLPKPTRKPKAPKPLRRQVPIRKAAKTAPALKKPKRSAPSIKTLREKADRLFSEFVRARDGRCIICGATQALQCSHFYGKKARPATRFDPMNAHAQCVSCHYAHHHNDPHVYADWMRGAYSQAELDDLQLRSRYITKHDRAYYEGVIRTLEASLAGS